MQRKKKGCSLPAGFCLVCLQCPVTLLSSEFDWAAHFFVVTRTFPAHRGQLLGKLRVLEQGGEMSVLSRSAGLHSSAFSDQHKEVVAVNDVPSGPSLGVVGLLAERDMCATAVFGPVGPPRESGSHSVIWRSLDQLRVLCFWDDPELLCEIRRRKALFVFSSCFSYPLSPRSSSDRAPRDFFS